LNSLPNSTRFPDMKAEQFGCAGKLIQVFAGYVFPYSFVLAGVITLIFGARSLQNSLESRDWPTVEGKILASTVKRHTSRTSGSNRSASSSRSSTSWAVDLKYEFGVAGTRHEGDTLSFGMASFSKKSDAQAKAREYAAGTKVAVFHHPEDPEKCCLETGVGLGVYIMLGLGGVFFVVGTVMSIFVPRFIKGLGGRLSTAAATMEHSGGNDGRPDVV
jgi:hypothetical protein